MSNPFPMHEGARCPDERGRVCTAHAGFIQGPTRGEMQAELERLNKEANDEESSPSELIRVLNRIDEIETVLDDLNYKDAAMYDHMERGYER